MKLYRRRYIPDEKVLLDGDEILFHDDKILVTKWVAIRPRQDFARGYSCYFFGSGTKVSKKIDASGKLFEHYCDIVEFEFDEDIITTNDLLVDVVIKPNGNVTIEDMGELSIARNQGLITDGQMKNALTLCDDLLNVIYSGSFADYISEFDKIVAEAESKRLSEPKAVSYSTIVPLNEQLITEGSSVNEQLVREKLPQSGKIKPLKTKNASETSAEENTHDGHRDRMRQKYLRAGIDAFADHELIELLIYYNVPRGDVNPLAHKLINEYGSLYNLIDAPAEEIAHRCGVNIKTAMLFNLIPDIFRRYETSKWDKKAVMNNSAKAAAYIYSLFNNKLDECLYLICLDNQQRLIQCCLASSGTVSETTIYPRNIVKTALRYNASYIILAHNHPSGILIPSQGDINTTSIIINALKPIGIDVLDHIIVSGRNYYSFSEKKLMGLVYEMK